MFVLHYSIFNWPVIILNLPSQHTIHLVTNSTGVLVWRRKEDYNHRIRRSISVSVMSFRQAVAGFVKRFRYPSQAVVVTSLRAINSGNSLVPLHYILLVVITYIWLCKFFKFYWYLLRWKGLDVEKDSILQSCILN